MNPNKKGPSKPYTVTVIIPSYNSHETIGWTLKGVKAQTRLESIREILVVDSSDDGITPDYLKDKEDDLIKVTRSGSRVMPAIQRNIGATMANGDLLCFVDSDAYPAPDWIELILEEYSKGFLAGGGSYLMPDFQKDKPIAYAQYFLDFSGLLGFGKKRYENIIPSCNLFCDRELFIKVGGFPKIRASEDSFFSQKIKQYVNMLYIPDAVVYHIFRENKDQFLNNQKLLGKYIYIYRRKSSNSIYLKGMIPYLFLPPFLVFKISRIFFRVLRTNRNNLIQFFKAIPLILRGLITWGRGFLEGVKDYKKEIKVLIT